MPREKRNGPAGNGAESVQQMVDGTTAIVPDPSDSTAYVAVVLRRTGQRLDRAGRALLVGDLDTDGAADLAGDAVRDLVRGLLRGWSG